MGLSAAWPRFQSAGQSLSTQIFNRSVDKYAAAAYVNHMVENSSRIDDVFHALAHAGRREMLSRLGLGELTVGEIAEPLAMSLAGASKHVKVLERAGLVRRTIDGRRHVCRLDPGPLAAASAWLRHHQQFWNERLDALEDLLQSSTARQKGDR
jgi:DNA-binding transcriptional ArsR family regulator